MIDEKTWTYDEIASIDDQKRREIYEGELFEMPSPTESHQSIVLNLGYLLKFYAQNHGGKAYIAPIDLYYSQTNYFIPDVIFYAAANFDKSKIVPDGQRFTVAPDIVAEVLSPSTARNDRIHKTRIYAEFGVAHYWILDPHEQTLEAFELREGVYFLAGTYEMGDTFSPPAFRGLEMPLERIFDL